MAELAGLNKKEILELAIKRTIDSNYHEGEYMNNYKDCVEYIRNNGFRKFILRGFDWHASDEGWAAWHKIYNDIPIELLRERSES